MECLGDIRFWLLKTSSYFEDIHQWVYGPGALLFFINDTQIQQVKYNLGIAQVLHSKPRPLFTVILVFFDTTYKKKCFKMYS